MPTDVRNQPIFLGTGGTPETFIVTDLPYAAQLGARFTINGKTWQIVKGDGVMATVPFAGAVLWWASRTAYTVSTIPTLTARSNVAGVVRGAPAIGQYFCIQVEGPCIVSVIAASAAAVAIGDWCIPSATAGKSDRVALGTATTHPPLGIFTTVATAEFATVALDLPPNP